MRRRRSLRSDNPDTDRHSLGVTVDQELLAARADGQIAALCVDGTGERVAVRQVERSDWRRTAASVLVESSKLIIDDPDVAEFVGALPVEDTETGERADEFPLGIRVNVYELLIRRNVEQIAALFVRQHPRLAALGVRYADACGMAPGAPQPASIAAAVQMPNAQRPKAEMLIIVYQAIVISPFPGGAPPEVLCMLVADLSTKEVPPPPPPPPP